MKIISLIATILVLFGALNWGLWGLFGIDAVAKLFGPNTLAAKATYDLIGLSAILALLGYVRK